MKIKRFLESEEVDISTERVGEIIEDLREFTSTIEDKNKMVESYINELNNYKNQSKKGNDQIDDSIAALQVVKKDLDDSLDKVDTIINNLMNYNDEGRKYLYTENK
jgi:ABC-type transporter Mla subunit MlaD